MLQSQIPITYFKFRNSEFNSSKWTHPSWPDELSTKLDENKITTKITGGVLSENNPKRYQNIYNVTQI